MRPFTKGEEVQAPFDWHGAAIDPSTVVDRNYRNTQNVRRFFVNACGTSFKFDKAFMAYMKNGNAKTMGDAAKEWISRCERSQVP